jgi:thiol-disulfide isomerase/thioredoxin
MKLAIVSPLPSNCRNGKVKWIACAIAWILLSSLAGSSSQAQTQGKPVTVHPATAESCPLPPKADAPLRDFKRISDVYLEVDGKQAPAELYRSETAGAILVISPALSSPVMLRASVLMTVDPSAIEKRPGGVADVKSGAVLKPLGQFEVTNDSARFTAGGRQAALLPTPPLLGLRQADEVKSYNPDYVESARKYFPNAEILNALKREQRTVRVEVFYGSWCSHCAMLVPTALRVEQELQGSRIRFEYFGVSRRYGQDPEAKSNGIRTIPTALVYVEGREVGRITGDDSWKSPESALSDILAAPAGRLGG